MTSKDLKTQAADAIRRLSERVYEQHRPRPEIVEALLTLGERDCQNIILASAYGISGDMNPSPLGTGLAIYRSKPS